MGQRAGLEGAVVAHSPAPPRPPTPLQVAALRAPSELQQFVAAVLVMRQVEAGPDAQRAQLVE